MYENFDFHTALVQLFTGEWYEVALRIGAVLTLIAAAITTSIKTTIFASRTSFSLLHGIASLSLKGTKKFVRFFIPRSKPLPPVSVLCDRILTALAETECLWEEKGNKGTLICGDMTFDVEHPAGNWVINQVSIAGSDPSSHLDKRENQQILEMVRDVIVMKGDEKKQEEIERMLTSIPFVKMKSLPIDMPMEDPPEDELPLEEAKEEFAGKMLYVAPAGATLSTISGSVGTDSKEDPQLVAYLDWLKQYENNKKAK